MKERFGDEEGNMDSRGEFASSRFPPSPSEDVGMMLNLWGNGNDGEDLDDAHEYEGDAAGVHKLVATTSSSALSERDWSPLDHGRFVKAVRKHGLLDLGPVVDAVGSHDYESVRIHSESYVQDIIEAYDFAGYACLCCLIDKQKCDGKKEGCSRCQKLGLTCFEPKVGNLNSSSTSTPYDVGDHHGLKRPFSETMPPPNTAMTSLPPQKRLIEAYGSDMSHYSSQETENRSETPFIPTSSSSSSSSNSSAHADCSLTSLSSIASAQHELILQEQKKQLEGELNPCNCKRSKCLKLYCECFAAEAYCNGCNCVDCRNTEKYDKERNTARRQILLRNPQAFNTPGTKKTRANCKCKKSGCLKKYCECFQTGVHCGIDCTCKNCKNFLGSEELRKKRVGSARAAEQSPKASPILAAAAANFLPGNGSGTPHHRFLSSASSSSNATVSTLHPLVTGANDGDYPVTWTLLEEFCTRINQDGLRLVTPEAVDHDQCFCYIKENRKPTLTAEEFKQGIEKLVMSAGSTNIPTTVRDVLRSRIKEFGAGTWKFEQNPYSKETDANHPHGKLLHTIKADKVPTPPPSASSPAPAIFSLAHFNVKSTTNVRRGNLVIFTVTIDRREYSEGGPPLSIKMGSSISIHLKCGDNISQRYLEIPYGDNDCTTWWGQRCDLFLVAQILPDLQDSSDMIAHVEVRVDSKCRTLLTLPIHVEADTGDGLNTLDQHQDQLPLTPKGKLAADPEEVVFTAFANPKDIGPNGKFTIGVWLHSRNERPLVHAKENGNIVLVSRKGIRIPGGFRVEVSLKADSPQANMDGGSCIIIEEWIGSMTKLGFPVETLSEFDCNKDVILLSIKVNDTDVGQLPISFRDHRKGVDVRIGQTIFPWSRPHIYLAYPLDHIQYAERMKKYLSLHYHYDVVSERTQEGLESAAYIVPILSSNIITKPNHFYHDLEYALNASAANKVNLVTICFGEEMQYHGIPEALIQGLNASPVAIVPKEQNFKDVMDALHTNIQNHLTQIEIDRYKISTNST